jgi:hypothetical protein
MTIFENNIQNHAFADHHVVECYERKFSFSHSVLYIVRYSSTYYFT